MKIKSLLFPIVAIVLVAFISFHIGGSMRGTNSAKQSISTADEPDHSAHSRINTVEETSQKQITELVVSPSVSEQIEAIEAEFEGKKQKVEEYYTNQFLRLRENVEISLKKLDIADKSAYAHFIEQLNNTTSESIGYTSVTGHISPYGTVSADGLHIGTTKTRVDGKPASDYELKVRELNKSANGLISEYKMDFEHLQRQKEYQLSVLEKEKKLAIEAVYNYASRSAQPIIPRAKGTVTGILYSKEDPSVVIDGEVLREGQSIRGVKVIKTNRDSVEFEYAGANWSQKVNDPPSTNWP